MNELEIGDVVWVGPSSTKKRLAVVLDPTVFRDPVSLWVRLFDGHSLGKPKKALHSEILSHADDSVATDMRAALKSPQLEVARVP